MKLIEQTLCEFIDAVFCTRAHLVCGFIIDKHIQLETTQY
jgi:hypothetical protein